MMTCAPGAMPLIGPRSMPKIGAEATGLPAAVRPVRPVAVGVARRADTGRHVAELARLGTDERRGTYP